MHRRRNMRFEIPPTKRPRRRFPLDLPLRAINRKHTRPMQRPEDIPCERAPDVVPAVVFLDMLEVGGVVDDVQSEEGDCELVGRSVPFIQRVPGFAAGGAVCLEFLHVAS